MSTTADWRTTDLELSLLVFLYLFDGASTVLGLHLGVLEEGNPLLAGLSLFNFGVVKLLMGVLGIVPLYLLMENPKAHLGVILSNTLYSMIAGLHVAGWMYHFS